MARPKKPMFIFKVTHRDEAGLHKGYSYHSAKSKADKLQAKLNRKTRNSDTVAEYGFELKKKQVVELLNRIANHPDNG